MKSSVLLLILFLSGVLATAPAKTRKDAKVSQLFCQARYVYVETADGDVFDPAILPEDRDAAEALQQHLQDWNRYTLVARPGEADLIWIVRTGRVVDAGVATGYPTGSSQAEAGAGLGANPGPGALGPAAGASPNLGANREDPADSAPAAGPGRPGAAASEVGDPKDLLAVFQGPAEATPQHTWVWRKAEADGLHAAGMPLFEQIRDAVDAQCSKPAGKSN